MFILYVIFFTVYSVHELKSFEVGVSLEHTSVKQFFQISVVGLRTLLYAFCNAGASLTKNSTRVRQKNLANQITAQK